MHIVHPTGGWWQVSSVSPRLSAVSSQLLCFYSLRQHKELIGERGRLSLPSPSRWWVWAVLSGPLMALSGGWVRMDLTVGPIAGTIELQLAPIVKRCLEMKDALFDGAHCLKWMWVERTGWDMMRGIGRRGWWCWYWARSSRPTTKATAVWGSHLIRC